MPIDLSPKTPVLIAGPTASGKSALALHIAQEQGGVIVNADALQVFGCWQLLSARPSKAETQRAPHALYGHIGYDQDYSLGHWLRDVTGELTKGTRAIIVGGTGLYFGALTEGLAEIPATPDAVRAKADALSLSSMLSELDDQTRNRIDVMNRMRVQRAWEVLHATGKSIVDWQAETPPPLLPLHDTVPIVLDAPKEWLTPRITQRFDQMLDGGAIDEARAVLPHWDPSRPASKAIGAPELIAYLRGEMTLDVARDAAIISTRQYAKRQRTWFRKRMAGWHALPASSTDLSTAITFQT